MEETSVEVSNPRFHSVTNAYDETDSKHYMTIWIIADYTSGTPHVTAKNEAYEVKWVELNNLPSDLFMPFKHLINGKRYPWNDKIFSN